MKNLELKLTNNTTIAVVTIIRESFFNALNKETLQELETLIDDIQANNLIRAIILTGSGSKAFCAGADTKELETLNKEESLKFSVYGNTVFTKLSAMNIPTISAINGYALGGGLELALSCDIRIASKNAILALPETTLGIIPGWGGTQRLVRAIGYSNAARMIFTGEKITADKAYQIGLISEITEPDKVLEKAIEIANKIVANSVYAISSAKIALKKATPNNIEGFAVEQNEFSELFDNPYTMNIISDFNNKK